MTENQSESPGRSGGEPVGEGAALGGDEVIGERECIQYLTGDATRGLAEDESGVLVHICNDIGAWGSGFVLAVSARWPEPEERYRAWSRESRRRRAQFEIGPGEIRSGQMGLGEVQFVKVSAEDEPLVVVANVVGQAGVRGSGDGPPIRYEAVRAGLDRVAEFCAKRGIGVVMPRIGAGLAGGEWSRIEAIVRETLCERGIGVRVYTLEGELSKFA